MGSIGTPLRVGIVVLAFAAAFGVGLTLIGSSFGRNGGYTVYCVFDDATGLGVRTRVQVAGIPIGQVERIDLDPVTAQAKVYLHIRQKYVLHQDATITKRSESILGDYLLDVHPGSVSSPALKEGDELKQVLKQPGVAEVFGQLNKIAADISVVTGNLRKVLGSDEGEENLRAIITNLARISKNLDSTVARSGAQLDAILENARSFSGDLAKLSRNEQGDVVAILQNTRDATAEARDILKTIGDVVGSQNQGDLKQGVAGIKGSLEKLDRTLANVESITRKIDDGQGTVGKLVNDDKLIKNLDKAAGSISNLLGQANELKIEVTERSELLIGRLNVPGTTQPNVNTAYNPWAKNYFGIKIQPKPDRWYGLELVDDPRGVTKSLIIQNQVNGSPPNPLGLPSIGTGNQYYPSTVTQTTTDRFALKYSVYFAKRFGAFSARFGLLESTGGFGAKMHLLNDSLVVSFDAFEFANPLKSYPRLKAYVDYRFMGHVLITAGADDFVNPVVYDAADASRVISGRDFFIGAGFFFTDEDLKLLLTAIPIKF